MRTSLKDIAEYTGLAKSTVSMHLNKHRLAGRLSSATKAKIDAAVKKFSYAPSYTARALSSGKTQTIGFVVGELALPYSSRMASALINETSKHDVQLLISATQYSPENEIKCLENLRNRHVDGIIYPLWVPSTTTEVYKRLVEEHYPIVLIFNKDKHFHSVMNDFRDGMRKAVDFFCQNRAKEVTIIADASLIRNDVEGMYGSFIKACEESGCKSKAESVDALDITAIDDCLERISENPPDFMVVQGALFLNVLERKLRRHQNRLPRIINIIDNWEPTPLRDEMLAGVIMCHPDRIIKTAVDTLLRLINKPMADFPPILVREKAEFLLSWHGDSSENTIDEVIRLMGYNVTYNRKSGK
jgi:DNA-binding LacI/PurR family transcriptional regulator